MPISSSARAADSGVTCTATPSASSTSAEPQRDDTDRLPCFAIGTPAAAATRAAAVEMLKVPGAVAAGAAGVDHVRRDDAGCGSRAPASPPRLPRSRPRSRPWPPAPRAAPPGIPARSRRPSAARTATPSRARERSRPAIQRSSASRSGAVGAAAGIDAAGVVIGRALPPRRARALRARGIAP